MTLLSSPARVFSQISTEEATRGRKPDQLSRPAQRLGELHGHIMAGQDRRDSCLSVSLLCLWSADCLGREPNIWETGAAAPHPASAAAVTQTERGHMGAQTVGKTGVRDLSCEHEGEKLQAAPLWQQAGVQVLRTSMWLRLRAFCRPQEGAKASPPRLLASMSK